MCNYRVLIQKNIYVYLQYLLSKKQFVIILLILASFVSNFFPLPLFFGVDFLFGSVFVILAIHHIGRRAGIIVALISSAYTITLWGHPYAFIIFLSEAIIVGCLYKKFKSLLIAGSIFWLFIGAPLILVFYAGLMGMDTLSWQLVMAKQILNGLLNIVIALLLIHILNIEGYRNNELVSLTLERSLRWFSMGTVLVPLIILMEVESYNAYSKMKNKSVHLIQHIYEGELKLVAQDIEGKILTNKNILVGLSWTENVITFFENENFLSGSIASSLSCFDHVILVNNEGVIVSVYFPSDSSFDKKMIGTDLSLQPYSKSALKQNKVSISDLYVGMYDKTFVSVTSPITREGKNKGMLVGVFRKDYLSSILSKRIQHIDEFNLELLDSNSNIIASDYQSLAISSNVLANWSDVPLEVESNISHFIIKDESIALMTRWRSSFLKKEMIISDFFSWKLRILLPLKKPIDELREAYVSLLLIMFGLLIVAMFIATYFARKIVKPFIEITKITKDIDITVSIENINWPKSHIQETTLLIDTLKNNRQVITNTINALTQKNIENEVITKSLKANQEYLDNILESVNECIATFNDEGIIESVNQSTNWVFGYEYGTLIGKHISLLIPEDINPLYLNSATALSIKLSDLNPVIPLLDKLSGSAFGRHENGRRFPIEISMTVTDKPEGKLLIAVIRDISTKLEFEEAQKALSQRMKMFFSVGTEGIIFHDQGTILDVNESGAQILGYDISELIGRKINELSIPDSEFNYLTDSKDTWEADALCKDGTSLPVEVKAGNQSFDGSQYISFINIEARRELENESAQTAKDLMILIDTANAPIFGIDNEGKVNEWNQKSAEITGLKSEEVLGKNLVDEFITADYRESVNKVLHQALKGDETSNFEFPLYTKDNKLVMVLLNATTRRNANGEVVGVVGVGQDITELASYRSEIETKVRDRTRELDSIFRLSPDGFVLANADNNVSYTNPAFLCMTGLNQCEVVGKSGSAFSELMTSLLDLEYMDAMKNNKCIGDEDCEQLVYLLRPTKRILKCDIRTMYGSSGEKEGQVLYFRDVTHETEVDHMKSDFLSTAAHELRTPLASIYGFSELLLARNYDKKMAHEMIETIHRQSLNLKHLLDELLDLSRIEARAGKDFYMMSNSLKDIVNESCTEIEGAFKGRKVDIQSLVDWRMLSFDKDKMRQVFRNLLCNGFKYSPDNENIQLKTSEREKNGKRQFGVSIIDKGIGMTSQQLSRLGERFYRADESGSTPGTGLGVSLVKEIVSIHDGETEFISTKGKGMTATVWLPIVKNQSTEE
ncbi:MAG: PAS domain S-box-containing protein [Colwellia sp.]|jgi:PAS domain S-box-containing protein